MANVLGLLKPSHTVPITRWRAASRWRARPLTLVILIAGLWLFGTGEAALVDAGIGNAPWTVFAQGLSEHLPISIGVAAPGLPAMVSERDRLTPEFGSTMW